MPAVAPAESPSTAAVRANIGLADFSDTNSNTEQETVTLSGTGAIRPQGSSVRGHSIRSAPLCRQKKTCAEMVGNCGVMVSTSVTCCNATQGSPLLLQSLLRRLVRSGS